ncbi:MAG: ATP-binding protein [bacterium]|nr:ATP-binding protein [bacterium]
MQEQQKRKDFVLTLLSAINAKQDLQDILRTLVKQVAELFDVDRVIFADITGKKYDIEIDYFTPHRLSAETIKKIHKIESDDWVRDLSGEIMRNNSIMIVNNINDYEMPTEIKELYSNLGYKSGMATKIETDGRTKAFILENFKNYCSWTEADKTYLDFIAKEITTAINQAKMIKDLEYQFNAEKTLLNNLPLELVMKDINRKYIAVNNLFLHNNKVNKKDVIGNTTEKLFPTDISQKIKEMEDYVLEKKETIKEEIQEIHGSKAIWKLMSISPILNKRKDVIGFIYYKMDISDQKEIDRIKSEFLSTISHELRTPLTSIIGGLNMVLSGALGEVSAQIKTLLDISQRNSKRLLTLINDLLDFEKLTSGKMEYHYETIDLNQTTIETIKEIEDYAKKYNVKVNYNADSNLGLKLNVDKIRFIQILTNLLSNAIKYTDNNKDVEIIINEEPDNKVKISVVNYGVEVPKNYKTKIYDRFTQVDSSITRKKGGTGLGLSITQQLVNDMNGKIDFTSKNGKTEFFIEFNKVV